MGKKSRKGEQQARIKKEYTDAVQAAASQNNSRMQAQSRHTREQAWLVVEGQDEGEPAHEAMGLYVLVNELEGGGLWKKTNGGPCAKWPQCLCAPGGVIDDCNERMLYSTGNTWQIGVLKEIGFQTFTPESAKGFPCELFVESTASTPDKIVEAETGFLGEFFGPSGKWKIGNPFSGLDVPKVRIRQFARADRDKCLKELDDEVKRVETNVTKALQQAKSTRCLVVEGLAEDDPHFDKMGVYVWRQARSKIGVYNVAAELLVQGRAVWIQDVCGPDPCYLFYNRSRWVIGDKNALVVAQTDHVIDRSGNRNPVCTDSGFLYVSTRWPDQLTPDRASRTWRAFYGDGNGTHFVAGFYDAPNVKVRKVVGVDGRKEESVKRHQAVLAQATSDGASTIEIQIGAQSAGSVATQLRPLVAKMGTYELLDFLVNSRPAWKQQGTTGDYAPLSVKELKDQMKAKRISLAGCVEKKDMVSALEEADKARKVDGHILFYWIGNFPSLIGRPVLSSTKCATGWAVGPAALVSAKQSGRCTSPACTSPASLEERLFKSNLLVSADANGGFAVNWADATGNPGNPEAEASVPGYAVPEDELDADIEEMKRKVQDMEEEVQLQLQKVVDNGSNLIDMFVETSAVRPDFAPLGKWQVRCSDGWCAHPNVRALTEKTRQQEKIVLEIAEKKAAQFMLEGKLPKEFGKRYDYHLGKYELMQGLVINGRAVWQQQEGGDAFVFYGSSVEHGGKWWWMASKKDMQVR
jgi:hypothetical protein